MLEKTFLDIAQNYDYFLCDLWGVIHDGENLYSGVLESLAALHAARKKLVFLSNAPRLAETVSTRMDAMGIKREWYHGAMTSGEAAVKWLNSGKSSVVSGKYYYLGMKKDEIIMPQISLSRAILLEDADFILNTHFEHIQQSYEDIEQIINNAIELNLPMLCINPDIEVVKMDGTKILSAGYIANKYKELGGKVEYIGKPYPYVFNLGMELLGNPEKSKVLMIGDNIMTDIKGGNAVGIDTAFVTQGILQNQLSGDETAEDYCNKHGIIPTHIVQSL